MQLTKTARKRSVDFEKTKEYKPVNSLSAVRKNVLPELKFRAGFFNLGELRDRTNSQ